MITLRAGATIDAGAETFVSFWTPNDYGMAAIAFGLNGHPQHLREFQWASGLAPRPPGNQSYLCPKFANLRIHFLTEDLREVWWLFGYQGTNPWAPLSNPEVDFQVLVDGQAIANWKVQVEPPAVAVMKTVREHGGWKHQMMGNPVRSEHLAAFNIQF
jgi:hypothetical protein